MLKKSILAFASALCAAVLLGGATASAVVASPEFDTFGPLPVSFGGSGIPNDAVAISNYGQIVLGLTAHQRYANPPLTNDGAGTFYAQPGGDILSGQPTLATWNIGLYSNLPYQPTGAYYLRLFYDTNPDSGNTVDTYFQYPMGLNDSSNLGYLGAYPMTNGVAFDVNAVGEYSFAYVLYGASGELARTEIKVVVGTPASAVPDTGATLGLLFAGLFGLVVIKSRFGTPAQTPVAVRRR